MIKTAEDLESFFDKLGRRWEKTPEGTYLISLGANLPPMGVRLALPVVAAEAQICPVPKGDTAREARFFRRLLELNATELLHAAYGIAGDTVVLVAALEAETLDLNELEAVLASFDMALSSHVPGLSEMLKA